MNRIKDERLQLIMLKNIRIAFGFQTFGIIAILVYDGIMNGFLTISNNPLWLVFIGSGVILGYLNIRISVDTEEKKATETKKQIPYYQKVLMAIAIGAMVSLIMAETGGTVRDSIITGVVIFVCFLIPYSIGHYLRKKRSDDAE